MLPKTGFFVYSFDTPKYIKYAAPTYLIIENAKADFAIMIESPKVAKIVCTNIPEFTPNVE